MTTGEILSSLIDDNDTNIQDLANYLGVNRRQITRWQKNEAEMGIYKLKMICLYYKISADYILDLPKGLKNKR